MSEKLPERADIRQLRIQAKELLRQLQSGESLVENKPFTNAKLADAQRLIARKYGFPSWPKLVDQVETPAQIEKFKQAIETGDTAVLEQLLQESAAVRKAINDPLFYFDSPAILRVANHPAATKIIPILAKYGADLNQRSKWWAGGFSALDYSKGETTDLLVKLGANYDVWSAATQGKLQELKALLDKDPESVNAPGGDGQRPLHTASTIEVAQLLIERGADLEVRDIDHESTPIQYQINNPEIVRLLLKHGAQPDVFTAVALDDLDLFQQLVAEDPKVANAKVGAGQFVTTKSNGGHIYTYLLGANKTPVHVAADRGSTKVLAELIKSSSPAKQLIAAALMGDEATVDQILAQNPNIGKEMGADARTIADAAQAGKVEAVRLLLKAGLDPAARRLDDGTALHTACWFGQLEVVKMLVHRVPLELKDKVHGGTPLSWAIHGSQHCRNASGDYPAVVRLLLESGADIHTPANNGGTTMLQQAGNREDVKAVLREYL
ncbi:MAG TPA: ankyrin repeat domain-containing protein [Fimbriimonas sp.]|nr:ankyrin repeat domain-containing protein [Fimbriimonas sp.]